MKTVQQLWEAKQWPIHNGIYFADNSITSLDVSMPWDTKTKAVTIRVFGKVRLDELQEYQKNRFSCIGSNCDVSYRELDLRVLGGEGSYGSDGFMAVSSSTTGRLIWLAFFDCSNPFEKVSLSNGVITGVTNLRHIWNVPLDKPEMMTVLTGPFD